MIEVIGWLNELWELALDATEAACWRVLGVESKGDDA